MTITFLNLAAIKKKLYRCEVKMITEQSNALLNDGAIINTFAR